MACKVEVWVIWEQNVERWKLVNQLVSEVETWSWISWLQFLQKTVFSLELETHLDALCDKKNFSKHSRHVPFSMRKDQVSGEITSECFPTIFTSWWCFNELSTRWFTYVTQFIHIAKMLQRNKGRIIIILKLKQYK